MTSDPFAEAQQVRQQGMAPRQVDDVGAAWMDAEQSLPSREWDLMLLTRPDGRYRAAATLLGTEAAHYGATGDTPAEALRAVASQMQALRGHGAPA